MHRLLTIAFAAVATGAACEPSQASVSRPAEPVDASPNDAASPALTTDGDESAPEFADAQQEGSGDSGPLLTPSERAALSLLSPGALPLPPADPTNRFADDPRAAAFGRQLFLDPAFSGPLLDPDNDGSAQSLGTVGQTGRVACAGCHLPESGFSDTRSFQRQISLGAGWGRRRAPSLLDVAQAKLIMWDGRRDTLYNQVFGPLESVVEMNSSRLFMAETVYAKYKAQYEEVFGAMPPMGNASEFPPLSPTHTGCQPRVPGSPKVTCDGTFHGMPGDMAEFDGMTPDDQTAVTQVVVNVGKALGAYERLLTCGLSPFDEWMHGVPTAISTSAQRGAALFVGRAACVSCHSGPFMSDETFHNVGLSPRTVQQAFTDTNDVGAAAGLLQAISDPLNSAGAFSDADDGRLPKAVAPSDQGAFRTPTLRCVDARPTFMHTGQLYTLADVVAFFSRGGDSGGYPGTSEIRALDLTSSEQTDLVAFLQSLRGPGASGAGVASF